MQLIPVTNESGVEIEIPASGVAFTMKQPMETDYVLGLNGAIMKVSGAATPFDTFKQILIDSGEDFEVIPIPEGNDAVIRPKYILFITSVGLDTTAIMFPGGTKVVVKEGINTLRSRLEGKPSIITE